MNTRGIGAIRSQPRLRYRESMDTVAYTTLQEAVEEHRFEDFLAQFPLKQIEKNILIGRFERGQSFESLAEEYNLIGGKMYAKRIVDRSLKKIKTQLESK